MEWERFYKFAKQNFGLGSALELQLGLSERVELEGSLKDPNEGKERKRKLILGEKDENYSWRER